MSQKVTTGVRPTLRIADKNQIPAAEPERQYYFMDIAKEYLRQLSEEKGSPLTFHVSTFGCQMNARDSEKLVGILEKIGFVEEDSEKADFVIYNTCTVRENANNKVYGRLGYLNGFQKKNPFMMIGLCGCMMQEPTVVEKIKQSYRFVNLIFGTHNIYKFAELIVTALENSFPEHPTGHGTSMTIDIWKDTDKIVEDLPVERKYSFKSGVNIMFGCNNFCSYCIVPYVRGRERSREPKEIIREVLPLQSGSSRILKLMNRRYDKEHYLELVDKIRVAVPDIALTTDIIVGFPGETEDDFEETMDVVRKVRYDSAFTFIYSKRTGTPAAVMEDQIPEEVIKARFDRLLKEVQTISAEKAGALTGQTLPVLIEEKNEQDAALVTGRLSNNSVVHLPGTEDMIGKIVDVKLLECKGFYYMGECV